MGHAITPRIASFIADSSVARGKAVKVASGYTAGHVALGAANTDRCLGIAWDEAIASGSVLEVALQGGGAMGLLGETVSPGEDLVSHTDGTLVKPNASADQVIARAVEGGVAGDLVAVEVVIFPALASQ